MVHGGGNPFSNAERRSGTRAHQIINTQIQNTQISYFEGGLCLHIHQGQVKTPLHERTGLGHSEKDKLLSNYFL